MPGTVEGTYKAREVEGFLDIYFYRRVGFLLARFFAKLRMTPTAVTALSGAFGLVAGHLYFYRDLRLNLIGMVLHVIANALDNADGQLARLTNKGSRAGRIIDSLSDHLVFVGIYLHLTLRCIAEGASPAVLLLAIAAGISHALQGAVADYCRNGYMVFASERTRGEFDSSAALQSDYDQLAWRKQPWQKFLLRTYLNFTLGQEILIPNLRKLRAAFPTQIPEWLRARYRDFAGPVLKWTGLLMTNIRMFFLFVLLIADRPAWYFWIELTALNIVLTYVMLRENRACRALLDLAKNEAAFA